MTKPKSSGTPGPLEVHITANGNGGVILWPDTSKGGVWKRRLDSGCDGVFPLGVAHVLSAAPDLLEACKAFADGNMHDKEALALARAAIAKAQPEGR